MLSVYKKIALIIFFGLHITVIVIYNLVGLKSYQREVVFESLSEPGKKVYTQVKKILPPRVPVPIQVYSHYAGTDTGYSLFAPNVPSAMGVIFELKDSEGNTTVKFPSLNSLSGLDRFTGNLSTYRSFEEIRPLMAYGWAIRMLEIYPEFTEVTVIIGSHRMPGIKDYVEGKRSEFVESARYEFALEE
jgi:hypothetical protein